MSRARTLVASCALVMAALAFAPSAGAYTVAPGDMLLRPVVGASVNVLRLDVVTKETPGAGMLLGLDFDYAVWGPLAVTAQFRPVLSPGFFDGSLGVGVKYRFLQLEAPFIPYASGSVVAAVGAPLGYGDLHVNVGARVAGGIDYFIMRNLAVGLEVGVDPSFLAFPLPAFELSTEALLGVTWRF